MSSVDSMNELLTSNDVVVADPNIKSAALVGHYLRLTDANRGGIVLREKIFTLRSHSSITNLLAEAVDQSTFKLKVTAYLGNNYVRNDGNVFIADTDSAHAAIFHAKRTELGIELYYNNERPALFDRHFDIGIGPWTPTSMRSQTPILIWFGPLTLTWRPQGRPIPPKPQPVIPGFGARSWSGFPPLDE
jgi:hypothetical protein